MQPGSCVRAYGYSQIATTVQQNKMARSASAATDSKTLLLAAAKAVMEEAGYAAVTSRRVAAKAGLKPQLIHYHFESMDQLLLELFRGLAKDIIDGQAEAIRSDQPLRSLWSLLADTQMRILLEQFLLMASYNPNLQAEMATFGQVFRDEQIRFMEKLIRQNGLNQFPWSPQFLSVMFNALARATSIEPSYGLNLGNRETLDVIEYYIDKFDRQIPDAEVTIRHLEQENARLRAKIADLVEWKS